MRSAEEQALPAAVRAKRDELELSIERLRETKPSRAEDDHYRELEPLLRALGQLRQKGAATAAPSR